MAKVSLRDHGRTLMPNNEDTNSPVVSGMNLTEQDRQDMITGLRHNTLQRIMRTTTAMGHPTKAEKYDRIEEILEQHTNDMRRINMMPVTNSGD